MKLCFSLFSMVLNQSITADVFFHWLIFVAAMTLALTLSRICLLIFPNSGFVGLINLQVGLFAKFGLWSLRVINASLLAVTSTLSSMPSSAVIRLLSCPMVSVVRGDAFLYYLVMFLANRSLYVAGSIL